MTLSRPSPWHPGQLVSAPHCWACHEAFTSTDEVKVIDAVAPKLVHAKASCVGAMVPYHVHDLTGPTNG